jgi:hypothetical protein
MRGLPHGKATLTDLARYDRLAPLTKRRKAEDVDVLRTDIGRIEFRASEAKARNCVARSIRIWHQQG